MIYLKKYFQYLVENTNVQLQPNEIITDDYIQNIIENELDEWIVGEYKQKKGLDIDINEIDESDFSLWLKKYLIDRFEDIKYRINSKINNNKITIWRALEVPDDWYNNLITNGGKLGIYWTFNKYSADTYDGGGDFNNKVVIESIVDIKYVDWVETYKCNLNLLFGDAESEIRLYKNSPLDIINIEINKVLVDIKNLNNKITS
jgi:hypothetical protein